MWMDDFRIDGLRLDAAECVDKNYCYADSARADTYFRRLFIRLKEKPMLTNG